MYVYTPADDIIKPAEHIPQQFITSCWKRVNIQKANYSHMPTLKFYAQYKTHE